MSSWRTLIIKATAPPIIQIDARAVYAKDKFALHLGSRPFVQHAPYIGAEDRGPLEATYAVAWLTDGTQRIECLTAAQTGADEDTALEAVVKRLLEWFPEDATVVIAPHPSLKVSGEVAKGLQEVAPTWSDKNLTLEKAKEEVANRLRVTGIEDAG